MQSQVITQPQLLHSYGEPCQRLATHDFVKKIEPLKDDYNSFISITENQNISLFKIINDNHQSRLECKATKKLGTYVYDVAAIPNDAINIENQSGVDLIAVSSKNTPVHIYKFLQQGESTVFNNVASFYHIPFNTESFVDFLALSYDPMSNSLFLGGKSALMGYDLTRMQFGYRSKKIGKKEIVSCLAIPNNNPLGIGVFGNFDKTLKVFSLNSDEIIAELSAHVGGLTCLRFSPLDNHYLVSGARKDNLVYLWDLRNTSGFVTYYERKGFTNQRLNFDISLENYLYLGNEDGSIIAYDLKDSSVKYYFSAGKQSVNNVTLINSMEEKRAFLVSTSGARNFSIEQSSNTFEAGNEDSDTEDKNNNFFITKPEISNLIVSNNINLWEINYVEIPINNEQVQVVEATTGEIQEKNITSDILATEQTDNTMAVENQATNLANQDNLLPNQSTNQEGQNAS